ncbi:hypothetical protein W97_00566 [Coniosporium apollinis CBS 100218]|uniref:C2H2-type domain-containing protein n=1 Tax=Coniosporium apollinis (strain CBS 100218) TaxID=1168221 RepID=R7YHG8_CONA1|nr:uncharacterized protein W97_00566 [Coniosporium apollinis CBS 100218]EON61352.1 hypothetical protein W97_00566 [Coniosporium apollinis CBS 100218]
MRTHTGECPFKCPYEANGPRLYAEPLPGAALKPAPKCSGAFGTKTGLDTHIRAIHTREKKFVCDFDGCDFACADSSNLSKHRRKHLGGNPKVFRCLHPGCGHAPKGSWDEIRRHFVAKGHCPELLDDQGDAQAEYKRKAREAKKMAPETRAREAKMRQVKMLKRGKAAAANSGTGYPGSTHPAPTAPDMMMMETTIAATTTYDYALPSAESGPLDMMMF